MTRYCFYGLTVVLIALSCVQAEAQSETKDAWVDLFNGKDLAGWTPKITGHELGDNFGNTFRVEDSLLKVRYDQYEKFGGKFGHIFYKTSFSNYVLRIEYRFVGEQVSGGPGWALRNSGVMLHCQDPKTMTKDQKFPDSIEVQMLGGNGTDERSNCNVCTPGTDIVMHGEVVTKHCISSTSKTYHGDQWVTLEVEVRGNGKITHKLEDKVILEYEKPQLSKADEKDKMLHGGFISLQSESHPLDFRKVQIRVLD